jgi:DNA segregation ATPase FtsK/SpoIIIE, S-DNA-T family
MDLCRPHALCSLGALPDEERPVPVVVLVDESAELFLMASREEKREVSETGTHLLRPPSSVGCSPCI